MHDDDTVKFCQFRLLDRILRLNPFALRVDGEVWWFEHSVSKLRVC